MGLVELSEIAVRIPGGVPDDQTARVQAMIDDASAVITSYTRRQFGAPEQVTHNIRPIGDRLRLVQRPVQSVESVSVIYNQTLLPIASFVWDGYDEVWLMWGEGTVINLSEGLADLFADRTPVCRVSYTYGYPTVPADVHMVACNLVLRAFYTPSAGALMSESTGPSNYRLMMTRSAANAGGGPSPMGMFGLTTDEREILNQYRRYGNTVELR